MASNNGHVESDGVDTLELSNEGAGARDIKSGNTIESVLVVDAVLLQCLSNNWDGRVHRVGDDEDVGLRAVHGTGLSKSANNVCVGVEQVITGHTGLTGNTSGDNDNIAALKSSSEVISANKSSNLLS
jgi:hypothetical protein